MNPAINHALAAALLLAVASLAPLQGAHAQATCSGIEFEGTVQRSSAIVECGVVGTTVSVVYYRVNRVVTGTLRERSVWVAVRCPLGERDGQSRFAAGQRHRVCISDRPPVGMSAFSTTAGLEPGRPDMDTSCSTDCRDHRHPAAGRT